MTKKGPLGRKDELNNKMAAIDYLIERVWISMGSKEVDLIDRKRVKTKIEMSTENQNKAHRDEQNGSYVHTQLKNRQKRRPRHADKDKMRTKGENDEGIKISVCVCRGIEEDEGNDNKQKSTRNKRTDDISPDSNEFNPINWKTMINKQNVVHEC